MSLPVLMDDLVDRIIIRFPPEEPELLVRASLVCKRWCRLISDPAFRRRFRKLHRAPPMLGVFCTRHSVSSFVPTSSVPLPHAMRSNWRAIDSRHGRVLLRSLPWGHDFLVLSAGNLLVWDPITDEQCPLPKLPDQLFSRVPCTWTAAVLCAAADGVCDHIDCHSGGSFLVVFMCTAAREAFTCVYSSETGAWSEPTSAKLRHAEVCLSPSVLVGNTLYFISDHCGRSLKILEHDVETQETSLIRLPRTNYRQIALVKMVDGRLGFSGVHESKLYLWSREAGSEKYAGWAQSQVIDLETLLRPLGTLMDSLDVICFVDGVAAIFSGTDEVFAIDLKSGRITKIGELMGINNIVPYMSFYTPVR
ncbi:uncharacterized protein LOC8083650 isoform X2 [Sorghum bicolor]|uniref:Uncharacterized protein n=1 Tax=Sorghum bicolor TaxID=4558 RepID=A0A1Z5S9M7_SORBI|nr:uncharacterized protein LOC8083650 isoform X2 [Sorghum bicolor]OQU92621.1 hypothetical protein SORBI_3001G377100 [Sorghum bicolor]|eukprot:XP_021315569.1 uncharacterized protein LOC8083650 isoform X2 [Sorghum bicolor]